MDERLTTENTGFYAGRWYDLPDGTRRYFTHEDMADQRRMYRKRVENHDAAMQEARSALKPGPKGIRIKAAKRALEEQRTPRKCEVCDGLMIGVSAKAKAHPWCRDELRRKSEQRSKAKARAAE